MTLGVRLSRTLSASLPRINLVEAMLRMDAAYRERRRVEEMTPELLEDIGLTRDEITRMLGRG